MEKKMTSGEMAKKAGVSQKAIRLYDEKGLLKPTEYSEGNYRLYDAAALQILEKIVALKQIGFSLEEIRDNLKSGEASDIKSALEIQLQKMEEKKYQLEKITDAIKRTLARKDDLDWDDVAGIVQYVNADQSADERHWDALKHTSGELDWYVRIFRSLEIKEGSRVLDLGCGYAKLWRNNWTEIPKGTKITGYDIHGSWADDFAKFIPENKETLPEDVSIELEFEDLEDEKTWQKIDATGEYDVVVAHYLDSEIKDIEAIVAHASSVVSEDGYFSLNGANVAKWNKYFKEAIEAVGVDASFIDEKIAKQTEKRNQYIAMMEKYFARVESVILPNVWHYTEAGEIVEKMKDYYKDQEKAIVRYEDKLLSYFKDKIEKDGEFALETGSQFWHCYKK
ncbi:DNA-binding transcriptional regulator, MerR family [Butyrivibrio sp. ob235]|uniref:MerR family transcriptional regulator n=1 Tax=Butyrivibrio sp. ob235 TaxID=1761780 RepID=UPI0008C1C3F2|nr:MerR family transcriptional regulator [Butyrivibrio sp. ob235]SEM12735.1 DNA-binding transcriptional regulator, MerR family [Butyrivibrio sp. ob235]